MHIEAVRLRVVGKAAVPRRFEFRRRLGAAIDRAAMALHPLAQSGEAVKRAGIELAASGRADVQQQVAALADGVNEHLHKLIYALPRRLIAMVAPGAGEGLAGFPHHRLAFVHDPAARLELLRRLDIPAVGQVKTVIEDDLRLQFAHHGVEFLALPVLTPFPAAVRLRITEVKPEDIHLAEFGEQLAHLAAQILGIARLRAVCVHFVAVRRVAIRADMRINDVVGMVPVNERVVEPHAHPLFSEGIHHRVQQVAARRRVWRLVIGELAIPQAEALVMLGCDDEVLHPRAGGGARPRPRVVEIRIKVPEVDVVDFIRNLLVMLHPLVAGGQRIQAPVNEEAKTVMDEPGGIARGGQGLHDIHQCSSARCEVIGSPGVIIPREQGKGYALSAIFPLAQPASV
ncbi:MAG: hypothetical protein BWY76_00820 [bacterium ADurb.Bin429]|nr:MAG: hypothetical protein BWY76_00820 [bacterium ADurb.Bin429]